MTEYIERDKVLEFVEPDARPFLAERIQSIPAADVRPVVRGKWVYDHWCEFKCSNCGAWSKSEPYRGRENFCPNCGADMRPEPPKEE